ncbi:uncharacterized protein LOC134355487 isoform X2 [Mobula hypostoma]|uniref:uncharacterized protein LOC134355487 isoform X2 n=1 Tax=Mobula hypostoma TaxID=723540 RepID=UPI002FC37A96
MRSFQWLPEPLGIRVNQVGHGPGARRCGLYLCLRRTAGAAAHLSALGLSIYVGVLSRLGTSASHTPLHLKHPAPKRSFLVAPSLHGCSSYPSIPSFFNCLTKSSLKSPVLSNTLINHILECGVYMEQDSRGNYWSRCLFQIIYFEIRKTFAELSISARRKGHFEPVSKFDMEDSRNFDINLEERHNPGSVLGPAHKCHH